MFTNIEQRIKDMHAEVKLKYKAMTNKDYPSDDFSFKGRTRTTLEKSFEKTLRDYVDGYVSLDWHGENEFVKKWNTILKNISIILSIFLIPIHTMPFIRKN